jgi:hypothetical protein
MKALKTLVAASVATAALLTSVAAAAQTTTPASNRVARDDAFGEFIYDALGATPKVQVKTPVKADSKVVEKDKAAVAKQDAAKAAARTEAARRDDLAKY